MHSIKDIANMFDETKWGKDFTRPEVESIARFMSIHMYDKGQTIFKQGERQSYMAFIVDGRVDILKESLDDLEQIVVTLNPRTHFGEMAFVDDEPRSASATARDDVTLLVLSVDNFERIVEQYPAIAIKMLRNIARMISQRLRMTTGKLVYTRV